MLLISEHEASSKPIFEEVNDRPGVLSILKNAELGFYNKENKNGRTYTKSLWQNKVLKNEDVMKKISNRRCYGMIGHPEGLQVKEQLISHVLVNFTLEEATDLLRGDVEILDTPCGRIAHVLAKAECGLGTSTRGGGDLVKTKEGTLVDENSYIFGGVDLVADPSNDTWPELDESARDFIRAALSEGTVLNEEAAYIKPLLEQVGITDMEIDASGEEKEEVDDMVLSDNEKNYLAMIDRYRVKIAELRKQISGSSPTEEVDSKNEIINRLKDRVKQLSQEIAELKTIDESENEQDETESDLHNELGLKIDSLTKEKKALEIELEDAKLEAKKTEVRESSLKKSVARLAKERDELKDEVSSARVAESKLEEDLSAEKAKSAEASARILCLEKNIDFDQLRSLVDDISSKKEVRKIVDLLTQKGSSRLGESLSGSFKVDGENSNKVVDRLTKLNGLMGGKQ